MTSLDTSSACGEVPRTCDAALTHAFQLLGKRWNGMILATLGQGEAGFADLRRILGISDSMLSGRLAELAAAQLVVRRVQDGPPIQVSYTLTEGGAALLPAMEALGLWAREHLN